MVKKFNVTLISCFVNIKSREIINTTWRYWIISRESRQIYVSTMCLYVILFININLYYIYVLYVLELFIAIECEAMCHFNMTQERSEASNMSS
jgi:hypothetical protein